MKSICDVWLFDANQPPLSYEDLIAFCKNLNMESVNVDAFNYGTDAVAVRVPGTAGVLKLLRPGIPPAVYEAEARALWSLRENDVKKVPRVLKWGIWCEGTSDPNPCFLMTELPGENMGGEGADCFREEFYRQHNVRTSSSELPIPATAVLEFLFKMMLLLERVGCATSSELGKLCGRSRPSKCAGVVSRDLHFSNVLFEIGGWYTEYRLIDFGRSANGTPALGLPRGNMLLSPPEVFLPTGDKEGPKVDTYAVFMMAASLRIGRGKYCFDPKDLRVRGPVSQNPWIDVKNPAFWRKRGFDPYLSLRDAPKVYGYRDIFLGLDEDEADELLLLLFQAGTLPNVEWRIDASTTLDLIELVRSGNRDVVHKHLVGLLEVGP